MLQRRQRKLNAVRKLQASLARRENVQLSQNFEACSTQQKQTDQSIPVFPPMIYTRSSMRSRARSTSARATKDSPACVFQIRSRRYMEGFRGNIQNPHKIEPLRGLTFISCLWLSNASKAENSVCDVVEGESFNWCWSEWCSEPGSRKIAGESCRRCKSD